MAVSARLPLSEALELSVGQLKLMEAAAGAVEHRRIKAMAQAFSLSTAAGFGSEGAVEALKKL